MAVPSHWAGGQAFRSLPLSTYWVPVSGLALAPFRDKAHCLLIQGCPGPWGQNYVPTDKAPLPEELICGAHWTWEGEEPSLGVLRESESFTEEVRFKVALSHTFQLLLMSS